MTSTKWGISNKVLLAISLSLSAFLLHKTDVCADEYFKIKNEGKLVSVKESEETLSILEESLSPDLQQTAYEAIFNGQEVVFDFSTDTTEDEDIQKYSDKKDYDLGNLFSINLEITVDDEVTGGLFITSEDIPVTVNVPDDLTKSGRTYYVLENDGERVSVAGKGTDTSIEISTDDFSSSYGIAYKNGESQKKHSSHDKHESEPVEEVVVDYLDELRQMLGTAVALGGERTIVWEKGTALPLDIMKTLEDHPQITLNFKYAYQGQRYDVTIPGSTVKTDAQIPWYGPLYLSATFGNDTTVTGDTTQ